MLVIAIATITALICLCLIHLHYQAQINWYEEAWRKQRQTIFFQFQRIEELEIERQTLHEVAVKALSVPDVEEYFEANGLEITTWRN